MKCCRYWKEILLWRKAEILAKKNFSNWKKAGKPKNENSELQTAKKESQGILRKIIKDTNLKDQIEENNTLMKANFRDPKLFSKLVNRNRNNNQGYTSMIKVGDKEYRGDNQVLAGFFEYHNNNSNPPPLHKSEENYT